MENTIAVIGRVDSLTVTANVEKCAGNHVENTKVENGIVFPEEFYIGDDHQDSVGSNVDEGSVATAGSVRGGQDEGFSEMSCSFVNSEFTADCGPDMVSINSGPVQPMRMGAKGRRGKGKKVDLAAMSDDALVRLAVKRLGPEWKQRVGTWVVSQESL